MAEKRRERKKEKRAESEGTERDGKLTPERAEAISSADLPSGDPELSAPAESADRSPDFPELDDLETRRRRRAA